MDLDSIRCFDAAATTLNFKSAAARVHLSPAAFSSRIQGLEAELGTSLFRRTTRRVELTDAGWRVLPRARAVLDELTRLRDAASGLDRPLSFELLLGTRYELGQSWLCPALIVLERARPERTLHLYCGDTPDLMARLGRGELDAVVASARLTSPALRYAALHPEDYVFVGHRTRVRGPSDVTKLTLVDVSPDLPLFRYFLDALADVVPWPFAQVEYMGGIGNIRQRVLRGGRVAVLPRYFVADDLRKRRMVRLMPKVEPKSDTFRLVWRTGHPREAELLALAEELRKLPLR
ncbi:MAG: LysR family transcriptional regulator [Myxococcales bacterium]|nr:LysR family transcriptional regulator [Myxococcales bacterium]